MAKIKAKFRHAVGEDYENFVKNYKAASLTRQVLTEYFEGILSELCQEQEHPKKIQSVNWQLEHAYDLGYRRALRYVIDLLNQDVEE